MIAWVHNSEYKCVSYVLHCSPKFVVTMNQVDEKYKTDAEKEVLSTEASDDGEYI